LTLFIYIRTSKKKKNTNFKKKKNATPQKREYNK